MSQQNLKERVEAIINKNTNGGQAVLSIDDVQTLRDVLKALKIAWEIVNVLHT